MGSGDSKRVVVGIDGGQTSVRCLVCTLKGEVLTFMETASRSRILDRANRQEAESRLVDFITFALEVSDSRKAQVDSVWIGMSGVPDSESREARFLESAIRKHFGASVEVHADSDVASSLYGAACFEPGVVVLSGTGSIAYGRDEKGRIARAGGWGYLLGDEGSGYAIGMAGIRAMIRAQDGLGPGTALQDLIMEELDLDRVYDIKNFIYSRRIFPSMIAALSRVVSLAATRGDAVANQILIDAGRDLANLVVSVLKQLDLINVETKVYPVGGVLAHECIVQESLRKELAKVAPLAVIVKPQLPPAAGSVILAMKAIGRTPDGNFLQVLSETLPKQPIRRPERSLKWDRDSLTRYLRQQLIVSCQATLSDFTGDPYVLTCMAKAAIAGGAAAIRANGPDAIREMREAFSKPILGINKIERETNDVYITPTLQAATDIIEAGADFIAVDATQRPRPDGTSARDLIMQIRSHHDIPIVADISMPEEAVEAARMDVDFIATTLAGYTPYSRPISRVDLDLIRSITERVSIPVIAEGKIWTPEDAVEAIRAGAWAIVVGSAITRPRMITEGFVQKLRELDSDAKGEGKGAPASGYGAASPIEEYSGEKEQGQG